MPIKAIIILSTVIALLPFSADARGRSFSGQLGSDIAFLPARQLSLNVFAKNAVAENLIARVDQARSARH